MNAFVDGALTMIADQLAQALKDYIARGAGLEAFCVIKTKEAIRVTVVDQAFGNWLTNSGAGNITTEYRIDQGGLADPGLAEDREIESTQGGECLGQFLLKHGLDLSLI